MSENRSDRRHSPWAARASDLKAEHGPYCDFAAWEEWVNRQEIESILCGEADAIFDSLDPIQKVALYEIMCKLADRDEFTEAMSGARQE